MRPEDCKRFEKCNAALCPLDPRWRLAVHLPGERVCFYLLASGKAGAAERLGEDKVYLTCLEVLPEVLAKHSNIRVKVEAAARTGFRRSNLPHLRRPEQEEGALGEGEAAQGGPEPSEGSQVP